MEIRLRLTLQFTILVAFLLATGLSINYYLAKVFANDSFLERLKERALVVASIHLEEDQFHQKQFDEINKRYNQILPGECISIFDKDLKLLFSERSDTFQIRPPLIKALKLKPESVINQGERVSIAVSYEDRKGVFFVIVSAMDPVGQSKLNNMLQTMFLSFVFFLVFIVLAGEFLAAKALQPIKNVIKQVHVISAVNLHERVKHPNQTDEIAQLAFTFNQMLDRLEEAFKTQSSFVRNASHELRNPLAAMIGQAEIALNKTRDPEYYQVVLTAIYEDSQRLKHIVNSLLQLSQANPDAVQSEMTFIRLDELALDVADQLAKSKGYHQIDVQIPETDAEEFIIAGNRKLLEVALSNLLDNACKYSDGKKVKCGFTKLGHIILLTIQDHGIGMSGEDIKHFMLPFYRSAEVRDREGFGIGMAIAWRILHLHGILIDVESHPGEGTKIELTFEGVESEQ